MLKECSPQEIARTFGRLSAPLPTLGITDLNGNCLIHHGFYPKIESGYTLSDILEENPDPKYFLSEKQTKSLIMVQTGQRKSHQQDKVYNPKTDKPNIPAGTHGSTPHLLKIKTN